MRKRFLTVLSLIVALAAALVIAACGRTEENPPAPPEKPTYTLNKTEVTLALGASDTLAVTPAPADGVAVEWFTSDSACVTVDDGRIEAVGYGSATVTAVVDDAELTCAVSVPAEYTYSLNVTEKSMRIGDTLRLAVSVEPEKALGEITWESSDPQVATVADGLVKAVADGTAKVSAKVDGKTLECAITVLPYEYEYEKTLTVAFGDETASIAVSVTPDKETAYAYEVSGDAISVDADGKITTLGVGSATVVIKDGGKTVGECVVTVKPNVQVTDKLIMHCGDTARIVVTIAPQADVEIEYEVTDGANAARVSEDGVVTALENGAAVVTVTVDGAEYVCEITVADVYVGEVEITELASDKDNPIDITDGAEYWEQYIAWNEVNHKRYDTADEDIISHSFPRVGNEVHYLGDYKAWLAWHGGASAATCSCGLCNKDTQNGGDGGWSENGTKSYYSQNHGVNGLDIINTVYAFDIKVFPGASVIEIYTGGHEMSARMTVGIGDTLYGGAEFEHGMHKSDVARISVNVKDATTLTVRFTVTDAKENGFISFCAARVTGDTYRLNNYGARLLVGESEKITALVNGEQATDGVTYASSDERVATVSADGTVTAVASGKAVITVSINGRARRFEVNVGYEYSLVQSNVSMLVGQTHDIAVASEPVGSTERIEYASNDTAVVTVDDNGKITAVAAGATTVDVTVGGMVLTVNVTVEDSVAATAAGESFKGKYVDFNANNVIYWEYYLFNEITAPTNKTDIIDGSLHGISGETNGYGAFINFTGGSPKRDSFDDAAYRKYSKGTHFTFDVTVPAGNHQIRVYTGAWENTVNKTSLSNGEKELASYVTPKTAGGAATLITFDITTVESAVLTVAINAEEGDNCRLMGMSVVDKSIELVDTATTTATVNAELTEELQGANVSAVNLSETGTLDWTAYNVQPKGDSETRSVSKTNADYIGDTAGINGDVGWDYRAAITWDDGDGEVNSGDCKDGDLAVGAGHNNFVIAEQRADVKVKVSASVKTITVYATSFSAAYAITAYDSKGNILVWKQLTDWRRDQSVAYKVTLDISASAEEEITVSVLKANDGANVGIAAIAVGG